MFDGKNRKATIGEIEKKFTQNKLRRGEDKGARCASIHMSNGETVTMATAGYDND